MAISPYLRSLRSHVGHGLLLVPAVAAVICDGQGGVLFQRRSDNGRWSLPAGAVEPGEAPGQAVVREVREETGLSVRPERVLGVFGGADCRVRYPNGDHVEYTVVLFGCRAVGGSLAPLDDETVELRYFSPSAMPALGMPYPRHLLGPWPEPAVAAFQWREEWIGGGGVNPGGADG